MFLKVFRAVNTSCVIWGQIGPILLKNYIILENWLTLLFSMYCAAYWHKISKQFSESESWNIRLYNFRPNWINYPYLERNFLGKLTKITMVEILNLIILEHFKISRNHIMRHNCFRHKLHNFDPNTQLH